MSSRRIRFRTWLVPIPPQPITATVSRPLAPTGRARAVVDSATAPAIPRPAPATNSRRRRLRMVVSDPVDELGRSSEGPRGLLGKSGVPRLQILGVPEGEWLPILAAPPQGGRELVGQPREPGIREEAVHQRFAVESPAPIGDRGEDALVRIR